MLLAVLETKYLVLAKLTDTVLSFSHSLPIPSSVFTASSTFHYVANELRVPNRTENNVFTGLGKVNYVYNKQQWA